MSALAEAAAKPDAASRRMERALAAVCGYVVREFPAGAPERIGAFRWSEANESARIALSTPDGNRVWLLVSGFADGAVSYKPFSRPTESELDTYENLCGMHYDDARTASLSELAEDLKGDLDTIDRYARSWEP